MLCDNGFLVYSTKLKVKAVVIPLTKPLPITENFFIRCVEIFLYNHRRWRGNRLIGPLFHFPSSPAANIRLFPAVNSPVVCLVQF